MNFGSTFALIGRNPKCGCPLAIDMEASQEAQQDFMDRGLLLEIVPESMARDIWESATWPCVHSGGARRLDGDQTGKPESISGAEVIIFPQ